MKRLWIALFLAVFYLFQMPVMAQGGVPIPVASGGTLIPVAPPYPLHAPDQPWPPPQTPVPYIPPTPIDPTIQRGYVYQNCGLVYRQPGRELLLPIQTPRINYNLIFTLRLVDAFWVQGLDGPYGGVYLERCAVRLVG